MRILDVFLLHCLLGDSPPDTPEEIGDLVANMRRVASRGREPGLRLTRESQEASLVDWGAEVLAECEQIAAALDFASGGALHAEALSAAKAALDDPALTPSARVLQAMARDHDNSYVHFGLAQSRAHRDAILKLPLSDEVARRFALEAEASIAEQRRIEASDTLPFEAYRQLYLAPIRLKE